MIAGSERVNVGESAASKKYRMTLAADKRLAPEQPDSIRSLQPFPIELPEPPKAPTPAVRAPVQPKREKQWEDRSWTYKLRHHLHMYDHVKAERKLAEAAQAKETYRRQYDYYSQDKARFDAEQKAYLKKVEDQRHITVTPPAPKGPAPDQLSDYDKAVNNLRKQILMLGKKREQQFNCVLEIQASCQENYNRAKEMLLLPGSEALAALKAKDYLNATRELERAKDKYIRLCDNETRIANTLEAAVDAEFEKEISENLGVVSEKIADDRSEVRDLRQELEARAVPESVMLDSSQANKDLATVLAEMQEKIKNDTRHDLGIESPQENVAQRNRHSDLLA